VISLALKKELLQSELPPSGIQKKMFSYI